MVAGWVGKGGGCIQRARAQSRPIAGCFVCRSTQPWIHANKRRISKVCELLWPVSSWGSTPPPLSHIRVPPSSHCYLSMLLTFASHSERKIKKGGNYHPCLSVKNKYIKTASAKTRLHYLCLFSLKRDEETLDSAA